VSLEQHRGCDAEDVEARPGRRVTDIELPGLRIGFAEAAPTVARVVEEHAKGDWACREEDTKAHPISPPTAVVGVFVPLEAGRVVAAKDPKLRTDRDPRLAELEMEQGARGEIDDRLVAPA
jgi:hypothetical protein